MTYERGHYTFTPNENKFIDLVFDSFFPGLKAEQCSLSSITGPQKAHIVKTAKELEIEDKKEFHPVNKPSHYNRCGIEAIQAIEAALSQEEFIGYLRGNIIKYQWRAPYKENYIQDVEKSDWYSNLLKQKLKEYGKAGNK